MLIVPLQRGKTVLKDYPGYNTKPTDSEAPILELWEMWSALSLPLLPGPLWPRVVVCDSIPSLGQVELLDHLTMCKQMTDVKLNC